MRTLLCIPLLFTASVWADEPADPAVIAKVIIAFNDVHQRASVLARDADLADLSRYRGPEVSQVYFEARTVRFVTPEVAVADAVGSQYGALILKRTIPALFVLKKEGAEWRVALLRITGPWPCW